MKSFDAGDPDFATFLEAGLEKAVKRACLSAAVKTVQKIVVEIIPAFPRPPVDVRAYAAAFRAVPTNDGAEIINTAPHAAIIEWGVRPENIKIGKAMIDALEKWCMRHGFSDEGDSRSVAFAIAHSMKYGNKKKGTPATGIFYSPEQGAEPGGGLRVMEKAAKRVPMILAEEIAAEIAKEFK